MSYKHYKQSLDSEFKKVLKQNISTNPVTLDSYRRNLILKYNKYVNFISRVFDTFPTNSKNFLTEEVQITKTKLNLCFTKLNLETRAPTGFLDKIESDIVEENDQVIDEIDFEFDMAMTNNDLLKAASQSINYRYTGDPLQLDSFIDAVTLIQTFATTDPLKAFLFTIIKSKLEGRAREYITATITTTDEIIATLREKIKPDSSAIIEGKFSSLKINRSDPSDFTKKAEDLADALRRSLIIEGVSPDKAESMTITKTVELCRSVASSDIVKSVVAATSFKSPKEVLAKYVTESSLQNKEKQILTFRKYSGNKYNSFNKSRGYNNNRFAKNDRFQGQGFRRSQQDYRYKKHRDQNNNRREYNQSNNRNNRRFVRTMQSSGNQEAPQARTLGAAEEEDQN